MRFLLPFVIVACGPAPIEQHVAGRPCVDVFAVHTCAKTCEPTPLAAKCEVVPDTIVRCEQRS